MIKSWKFIGKRLWHAGLPPENFQTEYQCATSSENVNDISVDAFAAEMKSKLFQKSLDGRGGWWDKDHCTQEDLSRILKDHVEKGDPLDVGIIAMMLYMREEEIL